MKHFVKNAWLKTKQVAVNGFNKVREYFVKPAVAATGTALVLASTSASAALPADVATKMGEAITDIGTAGALVIGVIIAIKVIKWIIRVF